MYRYTNEDSTNELFTPLKHKARHVLLPYNIPFPSLVFQGIQISRAIQENATSDTPVWIFIDIMRYAESQRFTNEVLIDSILKKLSRD